MVIQHTAQKQAGWLVTKPFIYIHVLLTALQSDEQSFCHKTLRHLKPVFNICRVITLRISEGAPHRRRLSLQLSAKPALTAAAPHHLRYVQEKKLVPSPSRSSPWARR